MTESLNEKIAYSFLRPKVHVKAQQQKTKIPFSLPTWCALTFYMYLRLLEAICDFSFNDSSNPWLFTGTGQCQQKRRESRYTLNPPLWRYPSNQKTGIALVVSWQTIAHVIEFANVPDRNRIEYIVESQPEICFVLRFLILLIPCHKLLRALR